MNTGSDFLRITVVNNLLGDDFDNPVEEMSEEMPKLKFMLIDEESEDEKQEKTNMKDRIVAAMLDNGLDSATKISAMTANDFVENYANKLQIPEESIKKIHTRAVKTSHGMVNTFLNLSAAVNSNYLNAMDVAGEDIKEYAKQMPNYQEIFGSLDFCECEHCNSIFGAAAYFVDLMRIADKSVKYRVGAKKLADRRPDLFTLELTCDNTNNEIPYIKIVTEIMEGSLNDKEIYRKIAGKVYPFTSPSHLPMEQIRKWLDLSGIKLSDIYKAWELEELSIAKEQIKITNELFEALTVYNDDNLKSLYGKKKDSDINSLYKNLKNIAAFLEITGLDKNRLNDLLVQDLTDAEIAVIAPKLYINQRYKNNDYLKIIENEQLNLTVDSKALEYIARFIHLSQLFNISYAQLEQLISIFSNQGSLKIDQNLIEQIVKLTDISSRYEIKIEDALAFIGDLKDYGKNNALKAIFGNNILAKIGKKWNAATDIALTNTLAENLKIDIGGLQILYKNMLSPDEQALDITRKTLSALYRHVRFAKILGINIQQYQIWLNLCGLKANAKFTLEDMEKVLRIKNAGLINIHQLDYIINDTNSVYAHDVFTEDTLKQFIEQTALKNIYKDNPAKEQEFIINELSIFFDSKKDAIETVLKFAPGLIAAIVEKNIENAKNSASIISKWLLLIKCGIPCKIAQLISKFPQYFGMAKKEKSLEEEEEEEEEGLTVENIFTIFKTLTHIDVFGEDVYYEIIENCNDITKLSVIIDRDADETKKLLNLKTKLAEIKSYTIKEIDRLAVCFEIMDKLKVNTVFIETLLKLDKESYDYANKVAAQISANNTGKFDSIETDKRDALLIEFKQAKNLKTTEDVYKYLLMDVSMSEAIKISYIKEGINALQLFFNRIRMGLEKDVACIDMPETFWSWIMSYSTWEANRKVFVYPENYLLPSTRRTKSKLFTDFESALQQAQITDGYVEEQYIKYLDEYAKLTKLKICAAYRTDIGGVEVLFLFGRTKDQPYEYYYCKKENDDVWTQWQKIDVNINTEFITPVYVFNKLHILWSELKPITNPEINLGKTTPGLKERTSYKMDIKYTFLNLQNNWIIPQTLVHDELIYYKYDFNTKVKNPLDFAFNIEKECFKKITALRLTNKNFLNYENNEVNYYIKKPDNYERLFIMTGPFTHNMGYKLGFYKNSYNDDAESNFIGKLNKIINTLNISHELNQAGNIMAGLIKVFNEDMQEDYLVSRNEYILFDEVGINKDKYKKAVSEYVVRPISDHAKNVVGIHYSGGALKDTLAETSGILPEEITAGKSLKISKTNLISYAIDDSIATSIHKYLQDKKIIAEDNVLKEPLKLTLVDLYEWIENAYFNLNPKDTDILATVIPSRFSEILSSLRYSLGSVHLFTNKEKAAITPVANQPGWYIYDCDGETFLLSPANEEKNIEYSILDKSIVISYPKIEYTNFSPKEFTLDDFNTINDKLRQKKIIDENRFMYFEKCTYKKIEEIFEGNSKINLIYSILHNRAIATDEMFASKDVTVQKSKQIFEKLTSNNESLTWARIDKEAQLEKDFKKELVDYIHEIPGDRLAEIFENFINSPFAVSVRYVNTANKNNTILLENFKYNVTRLTNYGIAKMKNKIYLGGIKRFLSLDTQDIPVIPELPFSRFAPNEKNIILPEALDGVQVDFEGLYSEYNWELFYHAPIMIAQSLKSANLHELAKKWFEYVFNPHKTEELLSKDIFNKLSNNKIMETESAQVYTKLEENNIIKDNRVSISFNKTLSKEVETLLRKCLTGDTDLKLCIIKNVLLNYSLSGKNAFYWNFRPFRHHTLEKLKDSLSDNSKEIKTYNNNPFNPHAIARLRIGAYEKYTVMEYVQNIIEWGDRQFTQYTWESITSATMLYVLACDLLGPRPQKVEKVRKTQPATFKKIKDYYQNKDISQFLLYLESLQSCPNTGEKLNEEVPYNDVPAFFGVPENKMLLNYWDVVEDRLYKIRHSMDINGVIRSLKLFEDPIDPLQLIRAAVFNNNNSTPIRIESQFINCHRFSTLLAHAKNLTGSLIQLSSALLSALEKYDSESLQIIHNTQEQALLNMSTCIKENQIEEIRNTLKSLETSLKSTQYRKKYYKDQVTEFMSPGEIVSFASLTASSVLHQVGGTMKMAGGISKLIPQAGSPFAMKYGGLEIGGSLDTLGSGIELQAAFCSTISNCAAIMASYKRRCDEWKLQEKVAEYDEKNIEFQIKSLEEKLKSAKQELALHKKTIEYRKEIEQYYKSKFTSAQLYQWMIGKLRGAMFQTYQLALEMCMKAQFVYQMEKNSKDNFITSQYWDGAKNGLLAGESLMLALNQMQDAYLKKDERVLEIEKNISLALELPEAFLALITSGKCEFALTEAMFANDFPGCYLRKIKTISISIPAVLGPYQTIKAILTQTSSAILKKEAPDENNKALEYMFEFPNIANEEKPNDVVRDYRSGQRIAISRGIDDSGMFTLNFNDERYLPFEETGAISKWTIQMPKENNRFDFNSISDVIINIKYTALESETHKKAVLKELKKHPVKGGTYYNLKQNLPHNWHEFMADRSQVNKQELNFKIPKKPSPETKLCSLVIKLDANFELDKSYTDLFKIKIADWDTLSPVLINQVAAIDFSNKEVNFEQIKGDWKIIFNLAKFSKEPELKGLLKDGYLDEMMFKNIELIIIDERSSLYGQAEK